jgi:hypothetical protein
LLQIIFTQFLSREKVSAALGGWWFVVQTVVKAWILLVCLGLMVLVVWFIVLGVVRVMMIVGRV